MPDLTAGGLKLHYVAAPERPRRLAVVFLHGAGANHTIWLGQMKALRDRAWVVLPDLPGHGRSAPIPGLTIEEYARALAPHFAALRASLPEGPEADGPRGLVLAGHSMGGAIALASALNSPGLFSGLVLVGTGAKLRVSQEIIQGLIDAPSETQALIARWSFADGVDPDLVLRTMRSLVGTPAARTRADFLACDGFDLRDRIGAISVPTLVLCGREDRMTPPKYAEFLRDCIPGAELRIIDGAGHGVMVEAPSEVSEAIADFLSRLPTPA